jgi:hypothetical protein
MAAALTLLLARWLPIRFEYAPNELGIVSLASERGYPQQQETFWAVFAAIVATLLAWLLARRLRRAALPAGRVVAIEALAAAALLAPLWLPAWLAAPLVALLVGASLVRASRAPGLAPASAQPAAKGPPERRAVGRFAWPVFVVGLACLLTPSLWVSLWNLAHGVPDEQLALDGFAFQGETGQHLAWADALLDGGLHGRDFFCLYGPLYDLSVVGVWGLLGRSIAAFHLTVAVGRVISLSILLLLGSALLRRRVFALAIPFLVPTAWVELRIGLPLLGLLLLTRWTREGRRAWCVGAGLAAGAALLYSQEFGIAFLVAALLAFAFRGDARAGLSFLAGIVGVVAPVLAHYAAHGALAAMLSDMVAYPGYVLAGYGNRPFPPLLPNLPLQPGTWGELSAARLGHAWPALCWGGLLLSLPISKLDPRRPLASLRELLACLRREPERLAAVLVSLFGLICFRVALGRSDPMHMMKALAPAAILVAMALDATSLRWRERATRSLAAWRFAALALLLLHGGFAETPAPLSDIRQSGSDVATLLRSGSQPMGSRKVMRVTRWIQLRTGPDDPVLFLPNNAAYYYLADRRSPIRFAMGHQIVTQAHRAEVLADLRADPPRFVVWDHDAIRVDGLPDERVFGDDLLDWLGERYVTETRIGSVEILRPRESAAGAAR